MKIFWSYASLDDMEPARKVSKLREAFEVELTQTVGSPCQVKCDQQDLGWGVGWREGIQDLIQECRSLVAVVTPSYFNSRMCIFELEMANKAGKKILPIHYRDCPQMKSTFKEDGLEGEINKKLNRASLVIEETQMRDFRGLRTESLEAKLVQDFLSKIAREAR